MKNNEKKIKLIRLWTFISILFILICINGISYAVLTETNDDFENYSEAYKEYLKLSEEEKKKIYAIPRKYNVPLDNIKDKKSVKTLETENIPSSYILTEKDTNNDGIVDNKDIKVDSYGNIKIKVENQADRGICWAFASTKCLETYLALQGQYDENNQPYDFSESHLDYRESSIYDVYRQEFKGGNFYNFQHYVQNENGPVMEKEVPYSKIYTTIDEYKYLGGLLPKTSINSHDEKKGFVDFSTIDKKNQSYDGKTLDEFRKKVKQHIMENGSIYASIASNKINRYNEKMVVNNRESPSDHAISIIGWDDNFAKENFPEDCRPKSNGAYIALNSWGEWWGNNGMFFISYEDFRVESDMSGIDNAEMLNLLSISIEKESDRLNYIAGEKFDKTNMKVVGKYKDGTIKEIKDYTISPEILSKNDKYVTIEYLDNGISRKVKQPIKMYDYKIQCGDNIYSFYNQRQKELNIIGSGNTYDYSKTELQLCKDIEKIIIGEDIINISKGAFRNLKNIKSIYFYGINTQIYDRDFINNELTIFCKRASKICDFCIQNSINSFIYDNLYKCGDRSYALLDKEDGIMHIIGNGETYDYLKEYPWKSEIKNIKRVEIGDEITSIGWGMFAEHNQIMEVTCGYDLEQIKPLAFFCSSLKNVELPKNLNCIHAKAFARCYNLETVNSKGIRKIENDAFRECSNLKEVNILFKAFDMLGDQIFENCISLEKISLIGEINNIPEFMFFGCTNLKYVTLSDKIKTIEDNAFGECNNLEYVNIPRNIYMFDTGIFSNKCTNIKIYIPDNITKIKNSWTGDIFEGMTEESTYGTICCKKYSYAREWAETNNFNYRIVDNNIKIENIEETKDKCGAIKLNIEAIGETNKLTYSFDGGKNWQDESDIILTKTGDIQIVVSDAVGNLTEIINKEVVLNEKVVDLSKNKDLSIIGKLNDNNVLRIYGKGSLIDLYSNNKDVWSMTDIKKNDVKSIIIDNGITTISADLFRGFENLETVRLPNTIKELAECCFADCKKLKGINFPDSLKNIGEYCFFGSNNIEKIAVNKEIEEIARNAFYDVNKVYYNSLCLPMIKYIKNNQHSTTYVVDDLGPNLKNIGIDGNKIIVKAEDMSGTKEKPYNDGSGINEYSFDGGITWQENNEYIGNIGTNKIAIKDNVGNVNEYVVLSSIKITKAPNKVDYLSGEDFDNTGMIVTAIYNDGSTKDITDYIVLDGKKLLKEKNKVTIRYTERNITQEDTQEITVKNSIITGKLDIVGNNICGNTLTAKISDLEPNDASLTYQWYFNDNNSTNGGIAIQGATKSYYTTENELVGKYIYVIVTAKKIHYDDKTFTNITDDNNNITGKTKIKGDTNGNDKIDIGDILMIRRHIAQENSDEVVTKHPNWKIYDPLIEIGDVNKNGKIDVGDILKLQRYIAATNSNEIAEKHPEWLKL